MWKKKKIQANDRFTQCALLTLIQLANLISVLFLVFMNAILCILWKNLYVFDCPRCMYWTLHKVRCTAVQCTVIQCSLKSTIWKDMTVCTVCIGNRQTAMLFILSIHPFDDAWSIWWVYSLHLFELPFFHTQFTSCACIYFIFILNNCDLNP